MSEIVASENDQVSLEAPFPLKGFFRIIGQRNFTLPLKNNNYLLLCHSFWDKKDRALSISEEGVHFSEVFEVSRDDVLSRGNGFVYVELVKVGNKLSREILGLMRIPLKEFHAAYHNALITNGFLNRELPIVPMHTWLPIVNLLNNNVVGEVECLLGIGTSNQIEKIKVASENWANNKSMANTTDFRIDSLSKTQKANQNIGQDALPFGAGTEKVNKTYRLYVEVDSARYLPFNPRPTKKSGKHIRSNPTNESENESYSSYVTFQAVGGHGPLVNSYEGMVFSTNVVTSSNPKWDKPFYIFVSSDYLISKNGRLIFKVWKTSSNNSAQHQLMPSPMKDSVIGFAAINLTTFRTDNPIVSDWFNIIDLNGDIKGQVKVTIHHVDDLQQLLKEINEKCEQKTENLLQDNSIRLMADSNYGNLNQIIRRKFNELDQISMRLRARLLDVANSVDCTSNLDDGQLDEFEHDINTPVCDDDDPTFSF